MPIVKQRKVDIFAIVALITTTLVLAFLVISGIYYFNLTNFNVPSRGESLFLFWTTIILIILILAVIIYSLIRIFTYEVPVEVDNEPIQQPPPEIPQQQYQPMMQTPLYIPPQNQEDLSVSFSDVPITQKERSELDQELLSLSSAMNA